MSEGNDKDRYLVPGLVRGIEILRMFSADRPVLTAPQIARDMHIPRSTVFRIAHTLEHLGLLERLDREHTFRLGIGVLGLGFGYLASLDISEVARPRLESLSKDTGLATHLVAHDGREVVVIQKNAGNGAFAAGLAVGTRLPAHATVLGRMILADLDGKALHALYQGRALERFSPQTPRSVAELEQLLAEDRKRGHAVSQSFFESEISAVAAPVRNSTGRVVCAINVTAWRAEDITEELIEKVVTAADDISRAIGYRPRIDQAANF